MNIFYSKKADTLMLVFKHSIAGCFVLFGVFFIFPAPSLADMPPLGEITKVTDTQIIGWACDPDKPDAQIKIDIWQHGERASGSYSKDVAVVTATEPAGTAVQSACGSTTANHGFTAAIPVHDPVDPFFVYAQNIDSTGATINYQRINKTDYIALSALTAAPSYRTVANNGAVDGISTKAGHRNQLATDGTYVYEIVQRGQYYVSAGVPSATGGIIEIKRSRIGSNEGFTTIWSHSGLFATLQELFIDTAGALHVIYVNTDPVNGPAWGVFHEVKSANPQATSPTFIEQSSPTSLKCTTCRFDILYDRSTDTIHFTFNAPYPQVNTTNIERRYYMKKRTTDAAWSTAEVVYESGLTPEGQSEYFFYPKLILFNGMVHIFASGNVVLSTSPNRSQFDGARHFYKTIGGTSWQSEWVIGPYNSDPQITAFSDDVVITPQNKLALLTHFSSGNGITARKASIHLSASGHGDWQEHILLPYMNSSGCFEKTSDGAIHLILEIIGNFLGYAKSTDGVNWQFYQVNTPPGITSAVSGPSCVSFSGSAPQAGPIAAVADISPSQTIVYTNPPFFYPQGHSVTYFELPSTALTLPMLTVNKSGTGQGTVTASGISCGSDCSQSYAYGTSVTLTASPASGPAFAGWSGSCFGIATTCAMKMNMNRTVGAQFDAITPPSPAAQPDLITNHKAITINGTLTEGSILTFSSSVKNQGTGGAAFGSIGRWCIDNANCLNTATGQLNTHTFGAIAVGATSDTTTSTGWIAMSGIHRIWWCADVTKIIAESNETNNCNSKEFAVANPPPPPIKTGAVKIWRIIGLYGFLPPYSTKGNLDAPVSALSAQNANPAIYMNVADKTTGPDHSAHATDLNDYTEKAGICYTSLAGDCRVINFTSPTCGKGDCSFPIDVKAGQMVKVVYQYTPVVHNFVSLIDRILTHTVLNVRSAPSLTGDILGQQPEESHGTIIDGPVTEDHLIWWKVNYDQGPSGWSAEDYLTKDTQALRNTGTDEKETLLTETSRIKTSLLELASFIQSNPNNSTIPELLANVQLSVNTLAEKIRLLKENNK